MLPIHYPSLRIASRKEYLDRFLVVATGENGEKCMPDISGLEGFAGTVIHSIDYKSGKEFEGKKVLVVGCGNSAMEIALDLVNNNTRPSVVVCSLITLKSLNLYSDFNFCASYFKSFAFSAKHLKLNCNI